jgi:hypothetical protein
MDNLNFYQFVNDISILVITVKGTLKRLYCPFPVKAFSDLDKNQIQIVEKVILCEDKKICYVINGVPVPYNNYLILKS